MIVLLTPGRLWADFIQEYPLLTLRFINREKRPIVDRRLNNPENKTVIFKNFNEQILLPRDIGLPLHTMVLPYLFIFSKANE